MLDLTPCFLTPLLHHNIYDGLLAGLPGRANRKNACESPAACKLPS